MNTTRTLLAFTLRHTLLGLALLATLAVSAFATMRVVLSTREVVVPPLVGRRMPEAGAIAAERGLTLRVEGRRQDAVVPAGHVVAQEPLPGGALKAHRSVRVWVSDGPRRVDVPAVVGQSLRTARLALEQAGVAVARVIEVDEPAAEGTVLVQRPSAGETDSVGAGAALLVSRGRAGADYVMPDLIGREARAVLSDLAWAGLKVVDVRYRTYPGVAPGIVIRQIPPAGHRVNARTPLSLDVSSPSS